MTASVVICVHNKLKLTQRCLEVLLEERSPLLAEIVVVDNGSSDGTSGYLETLAAREPLLRIISPGENLGFVGGNNLAAAHARGEYLVFLNNDTEPAAGWLEALLATAEADATVGAVGAKLVYPNGTLQEAGGVVFADGSGWNVGKGGNPDDPRYTFAREVDYCSGACLLVRRELFELHGRFDERFAPAYYEDTDLCFGIRALGYRVLYQPAAVVVHHEGATAGTDLESGFKRHQVVNAGRFREKWAAQLATQALADPSLVRRAANRAPGSRIMVVDPFMPMYDRASGSRRLHELLLLLAGQGHAVTFVACNSYQRERYAPALEAAGIEVHAGDRTGRSEVVAKLLRGLLAEQDFDVVVLSFHYVARTLLAAIREIAPRARVVFDTVDVHFVRELREAELARDPELVAKASETKRSELAVVRETEATITVSEEDRQAILAEVPGTTVYVVPNVHEPDLAARSTAGRQGLLFVGNFSHPPNVDAALFLGREVWPLVKRQVPEATLTIVGPDPPATVVQMDREIVVTGWVESVEPYLARTRVAVAPLRYGAGMKGKVGEALAAGVPVVTTPIGAEGIAGSEPAASGVIVADGAHELAAQCVRLLRDDALWHRLSAAGPAAVGSRFGRAPVGDALRELVAAETAARVVPGLTSIVILTLGELALTQACLAAIDEHTPEPYELILVDNGSPDETPVYLEELARSRDDLVVVLNTENRGFAGGCNQGLALARGDAVLFLNNDTQVTPGWLHALRAPLEGDARVALVGPVSNSVSGPQLVPDVAYEGGIAAFGRDWAAAHDGETVEVDRLVGFCLLARRDVLDRIGGYEERFASGNFEDDDLCLRVRAAGYSARIARGAYVHHEGSRTFAGQRIDYAQAMLRNWAVFKQLWGLPDGAALEQGYAVEPAEHTPRYVPLPAPGATHTLAVGERVWRPDAVRAVAARGGATVGSLRLAFAEVLSWSDHARRYSALRRLVASVFADHARNAQALVVAAEAVLASLEQEPAEPVLLNEAGVLLYGLGEADGAEALFKAAARLDADLPSVADNITSCAELRRSRRVGKRNPRLRGIAERAKRVGRRARPADGLRLSLCMIVKDEEAMIGQCLEAARPAVDEIIVVDTGSTDATAEIARAHGATVVDFPWTGSFSDARNVSLEQATGDWILYLDADEILDEESAGRIRELLGRTWREAFYLTVRNLTNSSDAVSVDHEALRLFRNRPETRFTGRIHEQHTENMPLDRPERFERTDVLVIHHGYRPEIVAAKNKGDRNRALLEQEEETAFTLYNLGTELLSDGRPQEAVAVLDRAWVETSSDVRRGFARQQFFAPLSLRVVQAHRLAGDPSRGLERAEEALELLPDFTDVAREAALCARACGDLEGAASFVLRSLELGDAPARYAGTAGAGSYLARALLASIRAEQGRYAEAHELLQACLAERPDFAEAEAALSEVRAKAALTALNAAARERQRGALELTLGGLPVTADTAVFRALATALGGGVPPRLPADCADAASALLDHLLQHEAFEAFEAAVDVWNAVALPERERREALARIYLGRGYVDSAGEEWLAVAQQEPDSRALVGLARVASAKGLREDAVELATEALRLDPESDEARRLTALLAA